MNKRGVVVKEMKPVFGPIADAIKKTGIDMMDFSEVEKIKDYDYLIVFYNKLFPALETRAKVGWWMNDLNSPSKVGTGINWGFDYIFLCNMEFFESYKQVFERPVFYMPQCGLDSDNISCRDINWEVLFIGSVAPHRYRNNRKEILEGIGKSFFLKVISEERTSVDQNILYRNTKYNLSISSPLNTTTSNRLFNILASGGFALVSYFPGLEKLFKNHQHLVWFKKSKEAIRWINYYDNNPIKYSRIKRLGHLQYLEKHTAKHRLENMFDIMEGKETKFRGWL